MNYGNAAAAVVRENISFDGDKTGDKDCGICEINSIKLDLYYDRATRDCIIFREERGTQTDS